MATYVNNLRLKEITTGDEDGTWGTSTNTNLELITDGFSYGTKEIAADANETFTMPDATTDATRSLYLKFTSAVSLTATREITLGPNTVSKTWIIENATTGGQIITIKQGSGATVDVANGSKVMIVTDGAGAGAAVFNANPTEVGGTVTSVGGTGTVNGITLTGTVTSSGNLTLGGTLSNVNLTSQVTGTLPVANGGTGVTSSTGTGAVVLSTSPTFTTPNLGTPSAATLTNATGLPLSTGVTGQLPLASGGTGASLVDPNADRIFFWDDSAGATTFLTVGSGLQISDTTLSSTDAGGTVTSVAVSGGTTGLTTSGGPVTTSGTITLAGTLAVANGGTGVTSSTGTGSVVLSTNPTFAGLTTTGNVLFGDNDIAAFGGGSDLQILHDGTNSFINDVGTGNLNIATNGAGIYLNKGTSENMAVFTPDGAVTLYYDNAAKIATSATGVTVTGTAAATAFSGSGASLTSLDAGNISSGTLAVANGGTGAATLTANNVLLGNGTSALQAVAPGTSGNVLTSNGTTWQSASAPTGAVTPLELTLISGADFSSGSATQIEFTSLSSSYDYYLLFSNDLNMGGQVNPTVTLSSNNGFSYGSNIAASGNSRSFGLRSSGSWDGQTDSSQTRIWTNSNYVTAYTYIWGLAKSQQVYFTTYYYSGRENAGYYGWQNGRSNNGTTNINALKYQFGGTATSGAVYLYGVTI
jgi:hypothetical protein